MLIDSQEDVFRKVSSALTQSSHSTNIGDLEESLLRATATVDSTNDMDSEEQPLTYYLRSRSVTKRPGIKLEIPNFSKSPKLSKNGKQPQIDCVPPFYAEEEMEEHSQESVSMLRDCYQEPPPIDFPDLTEACRNSELEVIDIYSDEEYPDESSCGVTTVKVENSTQTDSNSPEITHPREREMVKHAKFISSVVKLKTALSSKETISDKKLSTILQGRASDEESPMEIDHVVPKDTVNYLMRSSDVGNVFRETVQILLQHLEDALRNDFIKIACCWKNSVNELVVEMLNQAVDTETGVWKMVASFLCRTIGSILNDEESTNLILESKTNFIIGFVQSTRLSYSIVNCVIKQLIKLKLIQRPSDSSTKLSSVYLIKNSYFLLRILESSLEFLKSKSGGEERIEEFLVKKTEGKHYNVLEMWKKHWNRSEPSRDEGKTAHTWGTAVSEWCEKLDEISLHCLNHIPVLSMAVDRCGELAKEILKIYHSGVFGESNPQSTLSVEND